MAGYIGSKAVITSGVSASIDELNIIDGVTATTAELNTLDGVTAVVGELNALDIGSTAVGTAVASKAVILDSNKDYTGLRNITLTGELDAGSLDVSGNADIDGTLETDALSIAGVVVTTTAAELNIIDGDTARGTTAIVDADGVLVNDAGTMRMTSMATLATYMGTKGLGPTYTRQATAPSSPNAGDWWFNTGHNGLYLYDGTDGWVTDSTRNFGSGIYFTPTTYSLLVKADGNIFRTRFEPDGSFSDLAYRLAVITHTYTDDVDGSVQAVSNASRGVLIHNNTTATASMVYVAIATNSHAIAFGNTVSIQHLGAGCDHATRGVFAGGAFSGASQNVMEYITIASTGNGTDFGNLTLARQFVGNQAIANTTRGVFVGGRS